MQLLIDLDFDLRLLTITKSDSPLLVLVSLALAEHDRFLVINVLRMMCLHDQVDAYPSLHRNGASDSRGNTLLHLLCEAPFTEPSKKESFILSEVSAQLLKQVAQVNSHRPFSSLDLIALNADGKTPYDLLLSDDDPRRGLLDELKKVILARKVFLFYFYLKIFYCRT